MKRKTIELIIVNFLTIIRLFGAIALPFLYSFCGVQTVSIVAVILFATDLIDGFLARRWNVTTFFGALADGVCDKILGMVGLVILCFINNIMYIPLLLEGLILLVNIFKYIEGFDVKSRMLGKTKTWFLSLTIILSFAILSFSSQSGINGDQKQIIEILASTLIISQIAALGDYIISALKNPKLRKKIDTNGLVKVKSYKEIIDMLFDVEFYKENKDEPLRRLLYTKIKS